MVRIASLISLVLICSTAVGSISSPETPQTTTSRVGDEFAVAEESVVGIHLPDMSWNWLLIVVAFVVVGGCCCFVCISHSGHSMMNMFDPDGNCSTLLSCACPGCPCGQDTDNICVCSIS